MAQTLQAVFALNDRYTTAMTKILKSQDDFAKKQEKADRVTSVFQKRLESLKTSADTASGGVGGLAAKIGGLVSAAYLGKKALEGMFAAVSTANMQRVQETTFQALLSSEKVGSQLYAYTEKYAKTSAFGASDIAKGVTSFLTVTRDLGEIERLIKMTERLYAKDPTQGAEGAVFAMKEALSGDVLSLRNRFGITGVSGEKLRGFLDTGDSAGQLDYLDAALTRFGATQEVVDRNFYSLGMQTELFKTNLMAAIGKSATPVMEQFAVTMQRLNRELDAGKYQPFINVMVNGMQMIGSGFVWAAENASWLIPTLSGVMTALLIYNGTMKIVKATTELLAISTGVLTGRWISAAAALAAFAGSAYVVSELTKDIDAQTEQSLESLRKELGSSLPQTKMPVEITNTAPIPVKGEMEIESESLKYFADFANAKFLAMYSTSMVQPQLNIGTQNVYENADADTLYDQFGNLMSERADAMPLGVYRV